MMRFYYATHLLGMVLSLFYLVTVAPKYHLKRGRAVLCAVVSLTVGAILMKLLYLICFGEWGGQNLVRIFVFAPFLTYYFAKLFKIPAVSFTDVSAPAICIVMGIAKIGCQYVGCCRSWWEVDWGILNRFTGTTLFPIQLAESIVSLLIVAILLLVTHVEHYDSHGRQMPRMLILYGSTRFLLEFLRDNEKIIAGLSEYSLWSLLMVMEGVVVLVVLNRKVKRKSGKKYLIRAK